MLNALSEVFESIDTRRRLARPSRYAKTDCCPLVGTFLKSTLPGRQAGSTIPSSRTWHTSELPTVKGEEGCLSAIALVRRIRTRQVRRWRAIRMSGAATTPSVMGRRCRGTRRPSTTFGNGEIRLRHELPRRVRQPLARIWTARGDRWARALRRADRAGTAQLPRARKIAAPIEMASILSFGL